MYLGLDGRLAARDILALAAYLEALTPHDLTEVQLEAIRTTVTSTVNSGTTGALTLAGIALGPLTPLMSGAVGGVTAALAVRVLVDWEGKRRLGYPAFKAQFYDRLGGHTDEALEVIERSLDAIAERSPSS